MKTLLILLKMVYKNNKFDEKDLNILDKIKDARIILTNQVRY